MHAWGALGSAWTCTFDALRLFTGEAAPPNVLRQPPPPHTHLYHLVHSATGRQQLHSAHGVPWVPRQPGLVPCMAPCKADELRAEAPLPARHAAGTPCMRAVCSEAGGRAGVALMMRRVRRAARAAGTTSCHCLPCAHSARRVHVRACPASGATHCASRCSTAHTSWVGPARSACRVRACASACAHQAGQPNIRSQCIPITTVG